MLRSYHGILTALSAPIPPEHIKQVQRGEGKGGKKFTVNYLPWWYIVERLNQDAPGWSSEPVEVREVCGQLLVKMRLTLATLDGEFTQYGLGFEEDPDDENFGGPIPKAYATGIKRAAVLFGLGLDLYGKKPEAGQPARPAQRTSPDMTTPPPVGRVATKAAPGPPVVDPGESWHAKYATLEREAAGAGFILSRVNKWLLHEYRNPQGERWTCTREVTEAQLEEAIRHIVAQDFTQKRGDWLRGTLPEAAGAQASG